MPRLQRALNISVRFHHGGVAIHLGALCDDGTLAVAIRDGVYVLIIDARGESVPSLVIVHWLFVQAGAIHRGGCGCGVRRRAD